MAGFAALYPPCKLGRHYGVMAEVGSVFGATSARDERGMGPWMVPGAENTFPTEFDPIVYKDSGETR